MITVEQANKLANIYLANLQDKLNVSLEIVRRIDISYGWVFFYNSKAYMESGDISSLLAGNAPFLVDAGDGSLHVLGTAHPLEIYLGEYEKSRENK